MRNGEHQDRTTSRTSDQILGEIRDYCRATRPRNPPSAGSSSTTANWCQGYGTARRSRPETLDKVRAYLTSIGPRPPESGKPCRLRPRSPVNGATAATGVAPPGFRFFDNRQKYLLFVSTCSEKTEIANRISLELGNLQPSPPALRLFDAGVGDGTVLSRVMRALHARFPTMPLYVVAKEISYEDVRMMLEKMADRLFEHPATVLVITNLYYAEAPWLTPRSATSAQGLIWKDVALSGNTAHGFAEQIGELEGFLAENWRAGISPTTGNPVYTRPIILTLRREDHSFLLDPIMPRPGRVMADYDLVIASQPYRARASVEFKASKVVTPLVRVIAARRPADRHPFARQRSGHGDHRPGLARRRSVQDRSLRDPASGQARTRRGGAALQFQRLVGRPFDLSLPHAYASRTRSAARSEPRRCSPPGMPRSMSRRSRMPGCRRWSAMAVISKPPTGC